MDDDKDLDHHCYLQQFHNHHHHEHAEEGGRIEWWELLQQKPVKENAK